jgi:hypothetical protein
MAVFQDCIDKAEEVADLIKNLLTSDETTEVEGIPSLRKIVNDNKNKTASIWSSSYDYKKGDIVSKNEKFFYALQANTNKDPETETEFWKEKTYPVVAGTKGLEFTCLFRNNGDILRGSNYVSGIERLGDGHFKIHYKNSFPGNYIAILRGTSNNGAFMAMSLIEKNSDYLEFKSYNCSNSGTQEDAEEYNVSFIKE